MFAPRIKQGDTIGIVCPSHVLDWEKQQRVTYVLEHMGYKVKLGANADKPTYGYAASAEERAEDFNAMAADGGVKMVLFGGGDGAAEILPLINYEAIRRSPKIFCSYSDATSILNAVRAQTGLVTYYGATPGSFTELNHYNFTQFQAHFAEGYAAERFARDSEWNVLRGGECEGELTGGYAQLFALMLGSKFFNYADKKYILFLEDHEHFSTPGAVATYLAFVAQSALMKNVTGLIFGHYAENAPGWSFSNPKAVDLKTARPCNLEDLLNCLRRFGESNKIPVAYSDDFGHGTRHGIFPIGVNARMDTEKQSLRFLKG